MAPEFERHYQDYEKKVERSVWFSGLGYEEITKLKSQHILAILRKSLPPLESLSLLDVGCGAGLIHKYLRPAFKSLDGIDPSQGMIRQAQERNLNCSYLLHEGTNLPFASSSFDVILAICVLHHIPVEERRSFIAELGRVSKPNGCIVVLEHNPLNPITRLVFSRSEIDADATLVSREELRSLFSLNGISFLEPHYLSFFPFRPWFSGERLLTRLPLGAQYIQIGRKLE